MFLSQSENSNPTSQPGIPARIREFREALGMDQQTFADSTGVNLMVLDEIENGQIEPEPEFLEYLTNQYQANPEWLLHGSEPMRSKPHHNLAKVGSKAPRKLKELVHDIESRTVVTPLVVDSARQIELLEESVYTFPIEAEIAAGQPIENEFPEPLGSITLPPSALCGHDPSMFSLFRINGRSMEPYILHNDLCLVRKVPDWYGCEGQVVAVKVGYGITLKQLMLDDADKLCLLLSFNSEFKPILIGGSTNDQVTLIGKLFLLFRSYENWKPRLGTDPVVLTPIPLR